MDPNLISVLDEPKKNLPCDITPSCSSDGNEVNMTNEINLDCKTTDNAERVEVSQLKPAGKHNTGVKTIEKPIDIVSERRILNNAADDELEVISTSGCDDSDRASISTPFLSPGPSVCSWIHEESTGPTSALKSTSKMSATKAQNISCQILKKEVSWFKKTWPKTKPCPRGHGFATF